MNKEMQSYYGTYPLFSPEELGKLLEAFLKPTGTDTGRLNADAVSNTPQSDVSIELNDQKWTSQDEFEEVKEIGSVYETAYRVQERVLGELTRQHKKWGVQYHTPEYWYAIVAEEQGETAKSMLEEDWEHAIKEGIETIACIVQMIHEFERRAHGGTTDERYTSANTSPS